MKISELEEKLRYSVSLREKHRRKYWKYHKEAIELKNKISEKKTSLINPTKGDIYELENNSKKIGSFFFSADMKFKVNNVGSKFISCELIDGFVYNKNHHKTFKFKISKKNFVELICQDYKMNKFIKREESVSELLWKSIVMLIVNQKEHILLRPYLYYKYKTKLEKEKFLEFVESKDNDINIHEIERDFKIFLRELSINDLIT